MLACPGCLFVPFHFHGRIVFLCLSDEGMSTWQMPCRCIISSPKNKWVNSGPTSQLLDRFSHGLPVISARSRESVVFKTSGLFRQAAVTLVFGCIATAAGGIRGRLARMLQRMLDVCFQVSLSEPNLVRWMCWRQGKGGPRTLFDDLS